ncbi:transcriptional regulator [Cupriavidus sp. UYMU48A]|nr:transcriptional regulator [Cupriavidus sp. UYMU48A]
MPNQKAAENGDIDPAIVEALLVLRLAWVQGGSPWSLAKIAKRGQLPMSVLRRVLTQLQSARLADVSIAEDGRGHASLTQEGAALGEQLFSDPA